MRSITISSPLSNATPTTGYSRSSSVPFSIPADRWHSRQKDASPGLATAGRFVDDRAAFPSAARVTVLYFADTRFPIERANGTQTMATCHALAARGHDVTLVVRPDTAMSVRDPFAFYGLPPEARLTIRTIPT